MQALLVIYKLVNQVLSANIKEWEIVFPEKLKKEIKIINDIQSIKEMTLFSHLPYTEKALTFKSYGPYKVIKIVQIDFYFEDEVYHPKYKNEWEAIEGKKKFQLKEIKFNPLYNSEKSYTPKTNTYLILDNSSNKVEFQIDEQTVQIQISKKKKDGKDYWDVLSG